MVKPNWHNGWCFLLIVVLSGCKQHASYQAQGYIEGRYTYMATSVSGVLKELLVERGMNVQQGQRLFVLEEQPESDAYRAALENYKQAQSSRDSVIANLQYAKLTYERYKVLVPQRAIQQSELDNALSVYHSLLADLNKANANIAATAASLAQTKWTKEQKIIYAPLDAVVFDTYYRLGEYTEANQPILSLLAPENIKAIFYVGEKELAALKANDMVNVGCDQCKQIYKGRISFISPSAEYTPPVIYSEQTNEKLIYRIEATFAPQDAVQLHPGQPITVTYYPHG